MRTYYEHNTLRSVTKRHKSRPEIISILFVWFASRWAIRLLILRRGEPITIRGTGNDPYTRARASKISITNANAHDKHIIIIIIFIYLHVEYDLTVKRHMSHVRFRLCNGNATVAAVHIVHE